MVLIDSNINIWCVIEIQSEDDNEDAAMAKLGETGDNRRYFECHIHRARYMSTCELGLWTCIKWFMVL